MGLGNLNIIQRLDPLAIQIHLVRCYTAFLFQHTDHAYCCCNWFVSNYDDQIAIPESQCLCFLFIHRLRAIRCCEPQGLVSQYCFRLILQNVPFFCLS